MRISTLGFTAGSVNAMQQQQVSLARLQNQLALGKRVLTPSDDPIAMVSILELQRAQSASRQFATNATLARNRLNLEEQALVDVTSAVGRARDLILQAGNVGTQSDADRRSIATELASLLGSIRDIANRQDGAGEYLFAGFSTRNPPFIGAPGTAPTYVGDQGERLLQVSSNQRIADGHHGAAVFMDIPAGNGLFSTAVNGGNTGSGSIDTGAVVDRSSWVSDDYILSFTAADSWEVTTAGPPPQVIAAGAYAAGEPIEFNGVRVTVSGQPASGDSFQVNRSVGESVFQTLEDIVGVLRIPAGNASANARLASSLQGALQQLDQVSEHMLSIRAQVGVRLASLDAIDATREALNVDIAGLLSELRDLDYAQAVAQMNQQLVGLQAAQLSYTRIAQLSLFNYLR